jgi:adenine-specific DNA-methyltransferase
MRQGEFEFSSSDGIFKFIPKTRYQGSKRKIAKELFSVFKEFSGQKALDLFSGSGTVSLLMRLNGITVHANDGLKFNSICSSVLLRKVGTKFDYNEMIVILKDCLQNKIDNNRNLIEKNYQGIFYTDDENCELDRFCQNIISVDPEFREVLLYSMGQAMLMKRPYNLFHRANLIMRTKDVERSFGNIKTWNTSFFNHCQKIIKSLADFPEFANTENHIISTINTRSLDEFSESYDLVYLDPPYLSGAGRPTKYDNFYHFLDGLCDYNKFQEFDDSYDHRPILDLQSRWNNKKESVKEIHEILEKWNKQTIVLSYRDDGFPDIETIYEIFKYHGRSNITNIKLEYKYALSHSKTTSEIVLVSRL